MTRAMDDVADRLRRLKSGGQLRALLPTLGQDDKRIIERVLADVARAGWRSSPLEMAMHLDRSVKPWAYTRLLSDKFVDAVEGRSKRQIWNLPARYGKSMFASKYGPVWALDRVPESNLILASYGQQLAVENATFVRDKLVEHGDVFSCRLRRDRRRHDRFVTEQGGGLVAAGIGSALTGFPGDGAVIDDPFKNWIEAHSEMTRLHVWNWYRSVLRLRLESDQAWIIVVMTRWHEDDLTGKLLTADEEGAQEGWELVRLPAICDDPDDLLGRKVGEPLEAERFSLEAVLQRARALGSYLTAGLEQQLPAPEEGTDVMRGWWKWYDAPPPRFDDSLTSWDMKLKDKEVGDFVVGQAWGRTGSDFWMLDQLRGQWNQATTKTAIALMKVRYPSIRRHVIENTGNGPEVMEELRRAQPGYVVSEEVRSKLGITNDELPKVNAVFRHGMTGLLPENVKGSKTVRMRAQSPLIEAGNVHVPYGPIGEAVVEEAAMFPEGRHDDQVDALSQALKRLTRGPSSIVKPTGRIRTPAPGARSMVGSTRSRFVTNGSSRRR
jgi:phage terminase large subunit-like protein